VVHDASYYGVLELYGLPQVLLEALQLVSDPAGSDFDGMRFLSGGEEGRSMLYHAGQFPSGAICPVTFMWRPLQRDWSVKSGGSVDFELHEAWETNKRQLWLWIHPAAFMEAATAIAAACRDVVDEGEEWVMMAMQLVYCLSRDESSLTGCGVC
jgi:ribonuclease P/MRP protein subunit POP1